MADVPLQDTHHKALTINLGQDCNVRMYVHPMPAAHIDRLHPEVTPWIGPPRSDGLVGLEQLRLPRPVSHLVDYLVESGFVCPIDAASAPS